MSQQPSSRCLVYVCAAVNANSSRMCVLFLSTLLDAQNKVSETVYHLKKKNFTWHQHFDIFHGNICSENEKKSEKEAFFFLAFGVLDVI